MNPMPYSTPPHTRPDPYDRCPDCGPHPWHGLPCTVGYGTCECQSAWRDPEAVAS